MKKNKNRRESAQRQRQTQKRKTKKTKKTKQGFGSKLKHVVFGEPTHDDCPLCFEAAGGRPPNPSRKDTNLSAGWFVSNDTGAALYPGATRVSFVEVTVRGDSTIWPLLPAEPRGEKVPEGTTVERYLDLLTLFAPQLMDVGPVLARIDGVEFSPSRELQNGDEITVSRGTSDVNNKL